MSDAMSERTHRLFQFFAGYFNQDWDLDDASWREVVAQFAKESRRSHALLVLEDLRGWLQKSAAGPDPAHGLPAEFGCDYDPRGDGGD